MRRKKKKALWPKILLAFLSILVIALGGVFCWGYSILNKIKPIDPSVSRIPVESQFFDDDTSDGFYENVTSASSGQTTTSGQTDVVVSRTDPEDVVWPEDPVEVIVDSHVFNLLLIGQDARPGEGRQRSDSMIVLSYNDRTGKIKLISLMRDMYVQIPGYYDNKLNAAYAFGGMPLLDETIEKNFGLRLNGNVEVNFESFQMIINYLGGVNVNMNEEEAAYMRNSGYSCEAGSNYLNGSAALTYSRMRHVSDNDYGRTRRQRNVLTQAVNGVMGLPLTEQLSLIDDLLPYVATDLSKGEIVEYLYKVLAGGYNGLESLRIPVDGTFQETWIRNMAVLVPNLYDNRQALNNYIYG